jgi:hypothetical protein
MYHASGQWQDGDGFYLMTDAIACWFLRAVEGGEAPWTLLRALGTAEERNLAARITGLRKEGRLANDDITVLRVDAFVSSM